LVAREKVLGTKGPCLLLEVSSEKTKDGNGHYVDGLRRTVAHHVHAEKSREVQCQGIGSEQDMA
jgi:hypothetical protein